MFNYSPPLNLSKCTHSRCGVVSVSSRDGRSLPGSLQSPCAQTGGQREGQDFRRGSSSTGGLLVPETKSSYILIWCSACPGKLLPESRWASGLGVPSEAGSQRVVRTPTCGHCECPARTFSSPSGFTSTTKCHPLTLCCHHQIRNVMGFQKHH